MIIFNGELVEALPAIPDHVVNMAVDVETDTSGSYGTITDEYGLSYLADITVFSAAWYDKTVQRIAFSAPFSEEQLAFITECLNRYTVIGHNAVIDLRQLGKISKAFPTFVYCTMSIERLLHPAILRRFDLLSVANGYSITYPDFMKEQKKKRSKQHEVDLTTVLDYASWDSALAYEIYLAQINEAVIDRKVDPAIFDFEIKAVTEYCIMARRGIGINQKYAKKRLAELKALYDKSRMLLPEYLNLNSPKQKVTYIYDTLGIAKPEYKRYSPLYTASTNLSASADAINILLEIADLNDYQRERLKAIRDCSAILYISHDIQNLLDHASVDGAVHTMLATEANTRRRTSTHPQMHNKKMAGNPDDVEGNLTGMFCPLDRAHFTYVEIDFSNAENKFQAMIAGDNKFAIACNETDFHAYNASMLFPEFKELEPHSDRWEYLRFLAKTIVFGTAYGMEAERLSVALGIPVTEARSILQKKRATYRVVEEMKETAKRVAKHRGYVLLWTGAKVPIHPAQVYTASWNAIMQGGVAEATKRAMVLIAAKYRELGFKSYVAHDMHDALILGIHRREWDRAIQIASDLMSTIIPVELSNRTNPPVLLTASPDWRKNIKKWGSMQFHPKHCIIKKPTKKISVPVENKQDDQENVTLPYKLPTWVQSENGLYVVGEHINVGVDNAKHMYSVWQRIADIQGIDDSKLEKILGYSIQELKSL